jgi:hypothetical protein
MNCTSQVQRIKGLKPRRLKGLKRPTKTDPALGTLEYVTYERCHSWHLPHRFVPSRVTIVEQIVSEWEPKQVENAILLMAILKDNEREIRERILRASYRELVSDAGRSGSIDQILEHLDDWMALFWMTYWDEYFDVRYDCSDAPEGTLFGADQIRISLGKDAAIQSLSFDSDPSDDNRRDAFRQRVVPPDCGFVADSVADKFITNGYFAPTPELADLLDASIEQTAALLANAATDSEAFLRSAHRLLCHARTERFSEDVEDDSDELAE